METLVSYPSSDTIMQKVSDFCYKIQKFRNISDVHTDYILSYIHVGMSTTTNISIKN